MYTISNVKGGEFTLSGTQTSLLVPKSANFAFPPAVMSILPAWGGERL